MKHILKRVSSRPCTTFAFKGGVCDKRHMIPTLQTTHGSEVALGGILRLRIDCACCLFPEENPGPSCVRKGIPLLWAPNENNNKGIHLKRSCQKWLIEFIALWCLAPAQTIIVCCCAPRNNTHNNVACAEKEPSN